MTNPHVVIIGAGLSGLSCANWLKRKGVSFTVLEASERVGGRVATESDGGFLFDRGFQVFLPAYDEARKLFDYSALKLGSFFHGANLMLSSRVALLANPLRHPQEGLRSLFDSTIPLRQKIRLGSLQLRALLAGSPRARCLTTREELQVRHLNGPLEEFFLKPFFSGIFLEEALSTEAQTFWDLFSAFAKGGAALPADGMQELPKQLADRVPQNIRLGAKVLRWDASSLVLDSGETVPADLIVSCVPHESFQEIASRSGAVMQSVLEGRERKPHTQCFYFESVRPIADKPLLFLNARSEGKINSIAPVSLVAPAYAPEGKYLVSVNTVGESRADQNEIQRELSLQFDADVFQWRFLRSYEIGHPLPSAIQKPKCADERVIVAGDFTEQGSINGALRSGRKAAERVAAMIK